MSQCNLCLSERTHANTYIKGDACMVMSQWCMFCHLSPSCRSLWLQLSNLRGWINAHTVTFMSTEMWVLLISMGQIRILAIILCCNSHRFPEWIDDMKPQWRRVWVERDQQVRRDKLMLLCHEWSLQLRLSSTPNLYWGDLQWHSELQVMLLVNEAQPTWALRSKGRV